MGLGDLIADTLALQPKYSSANTEPMQRRGMLIRNAIPSAISTFAAELAEAMRVPANELAIEGRDGTGLKSEVPWVRFASRSLSPRATTGWYVVWLFKRDGSGVYLSLGHGSTQFVDGSLIARSDSELQGLMEWSRGMLAAELALDSRLVPTVSLASNALLALAYEKSCVSSYFYHFDALPSEQTIRDDMLTMARFLGRVYEAEALGQTPLSINPEVRDSIEAIAEIARPHRPGQGFTLSAKERRAVELHAMEMATRHFESLGYSVKDVSLTDSFDLEVSKGEERLKIEVKGTTGGPSSILLTRNEVALHRSSYPNNGLIVVHSIQLTRGNPPFATAGELRCWQPWALDVARLQALSYMYDLPSSSALP